MKPHKVVLHWFRRSIRLDDNQALIEACNVAETVVPVFILDPNILSHPTTGIVRTRFLFAALADIDAALRNRGSRLIIRHGQPVEELSRLARETNATALYFSRDYEPYSRTRDSAVTSAMEAQGISVVTASDHLLTEPGEILSQAGKPYTVFTPYKRVWWEHPVAKPKPAPDSIPHAPLPSHTMLDSIRSEPPPTVESLSPTALPAVPRATEISGSEAEARRLLEAFLKAKVESYDTGRERLAYEGTSRLSAHLKMGVISVRRVADAVRTRRQEILSAKGNPKGVDTFLSELAWRDFYYQILWHFPHVAEGAFRTDYNKIEWLNDETFFRAWCAGQTGYPIIDAAQRQLCNEAWMHNRARMITASFLTKDLLCSWQWGERYFMQQLIDGDLAANNGGWQWAASTGTDAQPFFRIFNPVAQGEKFDPDGEYVKRYVPELRRFPVKYIHRPWDLPLAEQKQIGCVIGTDYPARIVDHKVQREKALALYRKATAQE